MLFAHLVFCLHYISFMSYMHATKNYIRYYSILYLVSLTFINTLACVIAMFALHTCIELKMLYLNMLTLLTVLLIVK